MHIANPIYDVVFKYLMEDSKIAKLMISSIIGEQIETLRFLPQEFTSDLKNTKRKRLPQFTVYRLDFSATIKTSEGQKQVIIELQKAKFPTDIMRFRRYLGEQFTNKENTKIVKVNGKSRRVGMPIISIYFLGHKLDHTTASAIKISRQYTDLITGEAITTKESFIESLTLDSYVIQIPYLTAKRRNDLEIVLSIFDQHNVTDNEQHILNVNENDFPLKYRPIIRRLQQAILDAEIKKTMILEDGLLDEFEMFEREIEELENKVEKSEKEKLKIEEERIKVESENEQLKNELESLRKLLNNKK
jgi:hypothetical protein